MIEVNLLPGANRRKTRRAFALPAVGRGLSPNSWLVAVTACWIAGPAFVAWLYISAQNERGALEAALEEARSDSARYAAIIEATASLQAQRDTIAQKLAIIQEIDAGRYTWAHVMDELSWALPEYTWLTGIAQVQGGTHPRIRIEGRTGNNIALTQFMRDLEDSPFLREIQLSSTQQVRDNGETVYAFMLEATYEDAPASLIETVPLFTPDEP